MHSTPAYADQAAEVEPKKTWMATFAGCCSDSHGLEPHKSAEGQVVSLVLECGTLVLPGPLGFAFTILLEFFADKLSDLAGWHIIIAEELHFLLTVIFIHL